MEHVPTVPIDRGQLRTHLNAVLDNSRGLSHAYVVEQLMSVIGPILEQADHPPAVLTTPDVQTRFAKAMDDAGMPNPLGERREAVDGRDVYAAWCLALRERHGNGLEHRMIMGDSPPAPKDFAFLTFPEQHAWELLADSINNDCSIEESIERSRPQVVGVGEGTE